MVGVAATRAPVRSYLYAPGNQERLLGKVFDAGADAVILDLEDSVPASEKNLARTLVRRHLLERSPLAGPQAWVRIGALGGEAWEEDVRTVVGPGLTGVRVPKAESAADLERLDRAITACEEETGLEAGSIRLSATIESAAGLAAVAQLAGCARLEGLAFGAADFLADLGADSSAAEEIAAWVRPQLVVASRAAGLAPPVAPAWTRLEDLEGLRATTEAYRRVGFFGRSLIHPRQIDVVNDVFTPSAEEVERARRRVAAYDEAVAAGRGAVAGDDGEFLDLAVVRRARAVLELAEALGIGSRTGELV